ncbi:excalibur calcium-binding domain-containing protein [Streptomyces sp. NPDC127084]|uniref:excalibur calcium-binding domain-containing protein n=1 Tax=Streptomyces sp. NPDC127084 TaxID=3347133 RepID=UPI003657F907
MNPYGPNPGPIPPGPHQARSRLASRPAFWVAIAVTAVLAGSCGVGIAGSEQSGTSDKQALTATDTQPTATVTATVTATPPALKAEPQATVTKDVRVEVTVTQTVTEQAESRPDGGGSDDGGGGSDDNAYYRNCDAARAAGAAPVRVGDPGYGRHLDRDGDGVACE